MSEPSLEEVIAAAPPGVIMSATIDLHKVLHTDTKTGVTTTHVIMIGKIGEQEFRKEMQPVFLRALAGKGPMGKVLGKMIGTPDITVPKATDG